MSISLNLATKLLKTTIATGSALILYRESKKTSLTHEEKTKIVAHSILLSSQAMELLSPNLPTYARFSLHMSAALSELFLNVGDKYNIEYKKEATLALLAWRIIDAVSSLE